MEEHYFGAIRPTVNNFMKELDEELWKLGVAAKTKHNEVAPCQHELAPLFTISNVAIDHNLLTMELMRTIASHHGLVCLQHEKPFEGINGSGKHNNWSIATDSENLLDPGKTPASNLRFLVFLAAVVQAVDDYQDLLRISVASAGNDHRLGANEAPPAVISIFLGDELGRVVDALIEHNDDYKTRQKEAMDLGVAVLPNFPKDNTDRNRTSPFAFTGNKFEFRMPGSEVNLSDCNTILNTAVAKSLKEFADAMEDVPAEDFHNAAYEYIRQTLADHQRIIFNGDGYGEEWELEATRRGLANHRTTPDALRCMTQQKTFDLFAEFGVLNEAEVLSRYEVKLDKYNKLLNIESNVMIRQSRRMYMPDINNYCGELASEIYRVEAIMGADAVKNQKALLKQLTDGLNAAYDATNRLEQEHGRAKSIDDSQERATYYAYHVIPVMEELRGVIDELECICDHDYWPVPTYNDILFYG
jgi:glutamine synthetase